MGIARNFDDADRHGATGEMALIPLDDLRRAVNPITPMPQFTSNAGRVLQRQAPRSIMACSRRRRSARKLLLLTTGNFAPSERGLQAHQGPSGGSRMPSVATSWADLVHRRDHRVNRGLVGSTCKTPGPRSRRGAFLE